MIIIYYLILVYSLFILNKFKPIKITISFKWWSKINKFEVGGFMFFPFIFISNDMNKEWTERLIRHENVHINQAAKLTPVIFYILYVGFYLYYRINNNHYNAYMKIPFEIDAYKKQG
jgi:hypothetical protein